MAAKKTAGAAKQSKTTFVKSLPASMPAKDVVAKAKAQGISLTEMYVYSIRSKAKAGKGGGGKKRGPGRPPSSAGAAARSTQSAEAALVRIIERLVEEQVAKVLQSKLGGIFRA